MAAVIQGMGRVSGEAGGIVLRTKLAFSFVDDVDMGSGVINNHSSDIFGEALHERILVMPQSREKGFTVDTLVMLSNYKGIPAAILAEEADEILISACEKAGIPLIDKIDCDMFKTGDTAVVNADEGTVGLVDVVMSRVATSVLFNDRGELLVVRRSGRVGSHRGAWACISGYVEEGEEPEEAAVREMKEETGLGPDNAEFVGKAEPLEARDDNTIWKVYPCAFVKTGEGDIVLDWESDEYNWSQLDDVIEMDRKGVTVPRLADTIRKALALLGNR